MTTRITSSMTSRHSLTDIMNNAARLDRARQALSSQKQIQQASDDPIGTTRAIGARADLAATAQYTSNVGLATGVLQTTDSSLDEMTQLLQRARELTVRAASDTVDQNSRNSIALEIDQIASQLKSAGNSNYAGVYLFAGTASTTKPYNTTAVPPNDSYAGNSGTIAREIGPNVSIQVNTLFNTGTPPLIGTTPSPGATTNAATGLTLGDGGLLGTLRTLADNLRSGTVVGGNALKTTDLKALDTNLNTINSARATVGATLNRLEAAGNRLAVNKEASTDLLGKTEDVDIAQASIDYSAQQTVYQASLQVGAQIIQRSLLDFLS
jgi:flagellar hook-associated protein 3 FlgL